MLNWKDITRLERQGKLPKETSKNHLAKQEQRVLVISDLHGLHYDPLAWARVLNDIPIIKPHRIIMNGDMLDFYEISRYTKNPDVEQSVAQEIEHVKTLFQQLRLIYDGPIDFIPGNHEERYELYLRTDAKKLAGLKVLELPNLLELKDLGITMHQVDGFLLRPDYYVYHGSLVRKHAALTAQGELDKMDVSGTSGHTHRLGTYRKTGILGRRTWSESGCLCNLNPEFVKGTANWQHGYLIITFHSERPLHWTIQDVEIVSQ